jgi:N-acyl-D-amino-acid deacylase
VASYSGHGTLRGLVKKDDFKRAATAEEIRGMKELLARDLAAGAVGLSTGLEYDPGIYSTPDEVVALAKVAAAAGGRYISHVRSEDREFWKAIDEIIAIGREARLPVQVSHVKLAMRSLWGRADELVGTLDRARASGVDVAADIYPYTYWQSTLTVLFPERDFENKETAAFVLREIATPDGLLIDQFEPEPSYAGKTLAQISRLRGSDPPTTLVELIRQAEALRLKTRDSVESVIGTSMDEPDIERLMAWPHTNLCTDGQFDGGHPRGFGSFPRVLGRYVRERRIVSLEEAVRKMTSLAAAHTGIRDRGLLKTGYKADLVLFDPETVLDQATTDQPHALSRGVRTVWVAGDVVFDGNAATGKRPGRAIRR